MKRRVISLTIAALLLAKEAVADYEINLSVIDALGGESTSSEPPIPSLKPQSPHKTTAQKKTVQKTLPSKANELKDKTHHKNSRAESLVPESLFETLENKEETAPKTSEIKEEKIISAEQPIDKTSLQPEEKAVEAVAQTKEPIEEATVTEPKKIPEEPEILLEQTKPVELPQKVVEDELDDVLKFSEKGDTLSETNIRQLNNFADKIKSIQKPFKILIEAYNYDDGENSFARKRLSLNRAVTIRSYLMEKGYKSFNIKIINTENFDLRNSVAISY
ncbi:MAG: hypothetical protein IJ689_03780 [Alphaproteobacteria bacterium]|nr:hypothetical protein [Alphaproteobacteria bacterium]